MKKSEYVHFILKCTVLREAPIGYNNNFISNYTSTKFLGVFIENILKAHIDHFLLKLCMACYSVRTIKPFLCILFLFSFLDDLWNNLLGQLYTQHPCLSTTEKSNKNYCRFQT